MKHWASVTMSRTPDLLTRRWAIMPAPLADGSQLTLPWPGGNPGQQAQQVSMPEGTAKVPVSGHIIFTQALTALAQNPVQQSRAVRSPGLSGENELEGRERGRTWAKMEPKHELRKC
ncbi:hypothetical protein DPEC_G00273080 [Dallia pectoralis]|uniref:Uncharacterized protein n=1 Tax=Dallia pectoralis TaxID=75939 RepID=A0ACC2FQ57_DALPE|nr:hypothetical protein DPEC_G00273080 [Dallia pectoralis]